MGSNPKYAMMFDSASAVMSINVCMKTVAETSSRFEGKSKSCRSGVLEQIKKALFETDDYSFEIVNEEGSASENLIVLLSSRKEKIITAPLRQISTSEALDVFASITFTIQKENERKTSSWEATFLKSEEKVKSTEDKLRTLIVEKNLMEDHMYRAFHKCLNAKKDRIKQLLDELGKKKSVSQDQPTRSPPAKRPKKPNVLDFSDSDSESERGEKSDHSDEYDFDTDTDTEMSVAPNSKRDLRIGSQKPKLKPTAKLEHCSPNESFPEFPVTRKLRSTSNQLKLNSKVTPEKRSYADDEFNDETNHVVDETKELHSTKKQSKIVEIVDLEVMYDCDKLMDEI